MESKGLSISMFGKKENHLNSLNQEHIYNNISFVHTENQEPELQRKMEGTYD